MWPLVQSYTHIYTHKPLPLVSAAELTHGRENEEEEEASVGGGGDMYLQREENLGQIDTHAIIHIYAYTHGVCVLQP